MPSVAQRSPSRRPVAGKRGNYRYIKTRTAMTSDRFNQWAKALLAKGYRHMALDGTRFIMSTGPIPPEDRRNGPYSRITPDTTPSLIRDTLMKRQQRTDGYGLNGESRRVERLIGAVLSEARTSV